MRKPWWKRYLPLMIVLFLLSAAGGTFYLRSPVLIVTDPSFYRLYGPVRLWTAAVKSSAELFRRVMPVFVTETAGPDLMALAVEGASRTPMAVLVPSRYLESARYYKEAHPDIPVLVVGGRNPSPAEETNLGFICTDTAGDLYRAGAAAAALAGENRGILFYYDGNLPNEYREAFRNGLLAQEFPGDVNYLNISADYASFANVGCVILTGPAAKFLERKLQIPVILFSWANPGMVPGSVKLIFDDSPWALVTGVLKDFPPPTGEIFVRSEPLFLMNKEGKKDFRKILGINKEKSEEIVKKTGPES